MREAPAAFVAEMRRRFPDFRDVRWNTHVSRWEFVFLSAMNTENSQFLGWSFNPLTGEAIQPDPVSGLLPMRDLDLEAQAYVIKSCEETYLGNRHDGAASWAEWFRTRMDYNKNVHRNRRQQQAHDWAYAIQQMDIRRPGWRKDHQRTPGQRIVWKDSKPIAARPIGKVELIVPTTLQPRQSERKEAVA